MRLIRAIRLFCSIVFREWEPKSSGIPDEYRVHYRMPIWLSWEIACRVHDLRDKYSWEKEQVED